MTEERKALRELKLQRLVKNSTKHYIYKKRKSTCKIVFYVIANHGLLTIGIVFTIVIFAE